MSLFVVALFCTLISLWSNEAVCWSDPSFQVYGNFKGGRSGKNHLSFDYHRTTKRTCLVLIAFQGIYMEEQQGGDDSFFDDEGITDDELLHSSGTFDESIPRMNTVHLTGRVGNDPELRYLNDGKVVVNLSLASRTKLHWQEREANNVAWGDEGTDWYTLEIWSGLAEFVSKYVDKGARIGVIGSLQEDSYPDKETGLLRSNVKVIVRDLDVLETKAEADLRRSNRGLGISDFASRSAGEGLF